MTHRRAVRHSTMTGVAGALGGAILGCVILSPVVFGSTVSGSALSRSSVSGTVPEATRAKNSAEPTAPAIRLSSVRNRLELAGVFLPQDKINLGNLTVSPHEYNVDFEFDARLTSSDFAATLSCGVIDNNGFRRFFITDARRLTSTEGWQHHVIAARVALPDLTMGLRCVPDRTALYSLEFRDIVFSAVEVDHARRDDLG